MRRLFVRAVIFLASSVAASAADAAVRRCTAPVTSGPQAGNGLTQAQKRAIGAWAKAVAAGNGERFAGWRIAINKSLTCGPATSSGMSCEARATPCVIEQAPANALPPKPPEPKVIPVLPRTGVGKPVDT